MLRQDEHSRWKSLLKQRQNAQHRFLVHPLYFLPKEKVVATSTIENLDFSLWTLLERKICSKKWNDKGYRWLILLRMRHTFCFYGKSWKLVECLFGLYNDLRWPVDGQIWHQFTDPGEIEGMGDPGGKSKLGGKLESGSHDNRLLPPTALPRD